MSVISRHDGSDVRIKAGHARVSAWTLTWTWPTGILRAKQSLTGGSETL